MAAAGGDAIRAELLAPGARRYYPDGFAEYLARCDTLIEHRADVGTAGRPILTLRVYLPAADATPVMLRSVARLFRRAANLVGDPFFGFSASTITVNIVPSPARHRFPPPGVRIGPEHINGGFTYVTAGETGGAADIYILRREEMAKVVCHELLHHSRVHTADTDWAPVLGDLYRAYGIQTDGCPTACTTDLRPNEALVELWATLYHCKCLSKEYGVPFATLVAAERDHAAAQAARIEDHRATLGGGGGGREGPPVWTESTHAYSYITFRARILSDLAGFFAAFPKLPYDAVAVGRWLIERAPMSARAAATAPAAPRRGLRMTAFGDF